MMLDCKTSNCNDTIQEGDLWSTVICNMSGLWRLLNAFAKSIVITGIIVIIVIIIIIIIIKFSFL